MDFEEFVTLLGPKLTAAGLPDKFNGTDFDSVFWKVLIIYSLVFCPLKDKMRGEVAAVTDLRQIKTILLVCHQKKKKSFNFSMQYAINKKKTKKTIRRD